MSDSDSKKTEKIAKLALLMMKKEKYLYKKKKEMPVIEKGYTCNEKREIHAIKKGKDLYKNMPANPANM